MDKLKILIMLLICMSFVSATSVEKGHITLNEIMIPDGVLLISQSSITQTINSGDTINSQIILNLSSEKKFGVTFSSDLNVNFETENMTIIDGENILNFSATASSTSSGFIFMVYENQSYELIELTLNVNSPQASGGSSGRSSKYVKTNLTCGNGICETNETESCPSDCIEYKELNFTEDNSEEEIPEKTIEQTPRSILTGAVIGTITSTDGIITITALFVLVCGFFVVKKLRKKNSIIKNFK